jgi:hypothetical protein
MAKKILFEDENTNQLECFINTHDKLCLVIGQPGDDHHYTGSIELDKNDVNELISLLSSLEEQMEE